MKTKVIEITQKEIKFDNGIELYSEHEQDCCENHFLSFNDLTLKDFEDLEFDLSNDEFFERIPEYGIALKPIKGFPVRIPGYGSNNGYYSENLKLVISNNDINFYKSYDVTECQEVND